MIRGDRSSSDARESPWAFEAIGMPGCASTASLRRAFLARLAAASFVPDEYGDGAGDAENDENEYDDDDVEVFPESDAVEAAEAELSWTDEEVAATIVASPVAGGAEVEEAEVDFPIDADAARPLTLHEAAAFEQVFVARGVLPAISPLASGTAAELELQWRLQQVESFVAVYFDLESPERRARWQQLAAQCQQLPRLRARLARLERGLDVSLLAPMQAAVRVRSLARIVTTLFLLAPAERGAFVAKFFVEHQPAAESWSSAAGELSRSFPEIAALEGEFIAEVKGWSREPSFTSMTASPIVVGDEWIPPRWLANFGASFVNYGVAFLFVLPILVAIIAALSAPRQYEKKKSAAHVDEVKDAEKNYDEMEGVVLKRAEDLTPRDKHLLRFYGFLSADAELDGNQRLCLMFYNLEELRRVFRKHRPELIQQLKSEPPSNFRVRAEPAPKR
jgi:hypothetical protein